MLRSIVTSLVVLALFTVVVAKADDSKSKDGKDKQRAMLTSVDAKNGSITVMMKGDDGKKSEKTLQLASDAKYLDCNGDSAKLDAFHNGDRVVITEKDGKVATLRKAHSQATITSVDAKKGTVTVKMKDKDGKDTEKTFTLTEESDYIDSAGNVATIEVFQSGDYVLLVEADGKIKEMKKDDKSNKSSDAKKSGDKNSTDKKSAAK